MVNGTGNMSGLSRKTVITDLNRVEDDGGGGDGLVGEGGVNPDAETTASGIPISLLWLPYVTFTCVLLLLMIVSFIHFHKKNGHKYRRRQAEFWHQLNMQDILQQLQTQVVGASLPPNGGVNVQPSASDCAMPSTSTERSKKPRRPLTFQSNPNGSMVDLRLGVDASLETFQPSSSELKLPCLWKLASKDAISPSGATGIHSDTEDDEVFLLHQTQL